MKTTSFTRIALMASALVIAPMSFAQDAAEKETTTTKTTTTTEETKKVETGSLTDLIGDSVSFSILNKALKAAELDVTLGSKGAYTVFAPTDEAFDKLPAGALGKLMLPENKEKLRSLLLYHVVPGQVLSIDIKEGEVKTMNGEKIKINVSGDKIQYGDSKVFSVDVMGNNGVLHSVGEVAVPKTLDLSKLEK